MPLQSNLYLLVVEDVDGVELMVLALEAAGITFSYDTADTLITCQKLLQVKPMMLCWQIIACLSSRLPKCWNYTAAKQEIPLILITGSLGKRQLLIIKAGMTDYVLKDRLFRLPTVLERSLQEFALRHQQQAAVAQINKSQQEAMINRIVQAMRITVVLHEVLQTTADHLHESGSEPLLDFSARRFRENECLLRKRCYLSRKS